jgi:hypothetical protein
MATIGNSLDKTIYHSKILEMEIATVFLKTTVVSEGLTQNILREMFFFSHIF